MPFTIYHLCPSEPRFDFNICMMVMMTIMLMFVHIFQRGFKVLNQSLIAFPWYYLYSYLCHLDFITVGGVSHSVLSFHWCIKHWMTAMTFRWKLCTQCLLRRFIFVSILLFPARIFSIFLGFPSWLLVDMNDTNSWKKWTPSFPQKVKTNHQQQHNPQHIISTSAAAIVKLPTTKHHFLLLHLPPIT